MPIHERNRSRRDRWPLEFDLTGVPQDNLERERLLQQQRALANINLSETESSSMAIPQVSNSFAVDYNQGEHVIDINNPRRKNYNPHDPKNQFPKLLYNHESGHVLEVANEKQQTIAVKKHGFDLKPAPGRDYSKVRNGVAPTAEKGPIREAELSAQIMEEAEEEE